MAVTDGGPAPWRGGSGADSAWCVLAPNPGPMTLDGTNTWVLAAPGATSALVVDPGPAHEGHLAAVLEAVRARGADVAEVLLTHRHWDHAEGAVRFSELAGGVPVRALDPAYRLGDEGLGDGDVVRAGELELVVVGTPGHTSDSLSFLLPASAALLTGDTVLGRGTTVVEHPDGRLADYLDSLGRLRELAGAGEVVSILPGHGPVLDDALRAIEGYQAHRAQRLDQVRAAVAAGAQSPRAVVETVYADVDPALWPAAERSVQAQLVYLGLTTA
jgi:glyoxylase-like metal-dependent hydrolase (beta-lactamase superfamily II)